MLNKAMIYVANGVHQLKSTFSSKLRNAKGMELLQMVILIAIALAVGAVIMIFMNAYFGNGTGGFWEKFKAKLSDIMD